MLFLLSIAKRLIKRQAKRKNTSRPSTSDSSTLNEKAPKQGLFAALRHDDGVTPYVGARSEVSQIWLNRWSILLLLILARTLMSVADLQDKIKSAHDDALSACTNMEHAGSALASTPHYMATGLNTLTAKSIGKAIEGFMEGLLLILTAVEEIVVWYINHLVGTYMCLITFAVGGSLHVAIGLIEDMSGFLNTTLSSIGKDIHAGIDDFDSALNKAISGLNSVGSLFGSKGSIPTLDLSPQLDELDNVHLPTNWNADLDKLNASIPNYEQVKNFTDNVIRFPFEELKKLVNNSLPDYKMNHSMFPVPEKASIEFCANNPGITNFFQHLIDIEVRAREVAIAVLVIIAAGICIPLAIRSVRRQRQQTANLQVFVQPRSSDPMDSVYTVSRPTTAGIGLWASSRIQSLRSKTLVRWVVAYATTPAAIFLLTLGLAGLVACFCQWLVVLVVQREAPKLAYEVGAFADDIVRSMNETSAHWANMTNDVINGTNTRVNHDLFGWVNTSTTAINDTLNAFTDQMVDVLNATFGGTVLYEPIMDVYNCLIGLKVEGIEAGLTWVHDHAHIDFPLMPNDTLSVGAAEAVANDDSAKKFLADPSGDATSSITAGLDRLINKALKAIRTEAIISAVLVALFVANFLVGVTRALWQMLSKAKVANNGFDDGASSGKGSVGMVSFPTEKMGGDPDLDQSQKNAFASTQKPTGGYQTDSFVTAPRFQAQSNIENGSEGNRWKGMSYTLQPTPFTAKKPVPAAVGPMGPPRRSHYTDMY